jgi:hypothetical protein
MNEITDNALTWLATVWHEWTAGIAASIARRGKTISKGAADADNLNVSGRRYD